jgi:hypothetical protein
MRGILKTKINEYKNKKADKQDDSFESDITKREERIRMERQLLVLRDRCEENVRSHVNLARIEKDSVYGYGKISSETLAQIGLGLQGLSMIDRIRENLNSYIARQDLTQIFGELTGVMGGLTESVGTDPQLNANKMIKECSRAMHSMDGSSMIRSLNKLQEHEEIWKEKMDLKDTVYNTDAILRVVDGASINQVIHPELYQKSLQDVDSMDDIDMLLRKVKESKHLMQEEVSQAAVVSETADLGAAGTSSNLIDRKSLLETL